MSKTKKSGSGRYEMLFIIANNYTEDEAKQIISKTEALLEENNTTIVYREYWGKKKLAYPIGQNHYGYYSLCEFETERQHVLELNRLLSLSKEILRHQIVSVPALSNEEREKMKQKQIEAATKDVKEEKGNKEKIEKVSDKIEKIEKKDTKKTDLKNLDEKLEGIINAKDLV